MSAAVAWVLLVAVLAALVLALGPRLLRRERRDEVARFHRARAMTTAWSREGLTRPVPADADAEAAGAGPEPADRAGPPARR